MKACDAQMAFLLLIAILELAALRASPPAEVRLGGLFPSFRTSGSVIIAGQQRMAAFLMAVKEINANPDILPNTTIKIAVRDTRLHAGKAFLATLDMVTNAFNKSGIDGCIGAATSAESDAASDVLTQYSTVQVSYSSTSSILSSRTAYPFFARTCPADTFQGAAIADLVFNRYGW